MTKTHLLQIGRGPTASPSGSATTAHGAGRVLTAASRAALRKTGCRSVLAITRHRGAGVLPPTAYTCDALLPTVSGATAFPHRSATVVPAAGRALAAVSRVAPAVPGCRFALAIAVHRGAAVFPPTAYMCGALRSTVSGAIASPFESLTVYPGAGRRDVGASRTRRSFHRCRSVLAITRHRGAGVFPPTAYTCDA